MNKDLIDDFTDFPEPAPLLRAGDRVKYIPGHAHGDDTHQDCETGTVTSVKPGRVFVLFRGCTPQACTPSDLKLLCREGGKP